ncbi:hypothetical protein [Kibdelosporangium philippinense]|uniref:hypothetical protein n=1 Tax=Kibdelosporangium philippinense TaxID=211113 RepID=UPI0036204205
MATGSMAAMAILTVTMAMGMAGATGTGTAARTPCPTCGFRVKDPVCPTSA